MIVPFVCAGCGRKLRSDKPGSLVTCPACRHLTEVPVFVPNLPGPQVKPPPLPEFAEVAEPEAEVPARKRPFYRDPIVLVGAAVPTVILAAFFGYLANQRAERVFREQAYALKAQADAHAQAGRHRSALESYDSLLAHVGDRAPDDSQFRADLDAARRAREAALARVDEIKKKETLAAEAEAKFQAVLKSYRDEDEQLGKLKVEVSGTAWLEPNLSKALPIRALEIYLVPGRVAKAKVADVIEEARARLANRKRVLASAMKSTGAEEVPEANRLMSQLDLAEGKATSLLAERTDTILDTIEVYRLIRSDVGEMSVDRIPKEPLWPKVVGRLLATKASTGFDGKYHLKEMKGGVYYAYAILSDDSGVLEWVLPLRADKASGVDLDLHNGNATLKLSAR